MILDSALAFLAGLLSFASTCVLPLVPAYVAYMGAAATGTEMTVRQQLKVLGNAALFVAGFATAFIALGASFGLIGADLKAYRPLLLQISGVALVLIGIALLTLGRIPGLMGEKRFDIAHRLPRAPWASYVIGLAFAIGWTPCVGPILAAILLRAGSTGTAAQGAVLLAFYSAGLGLPFLIAAGLSGVLTRMLVRVRGAYATLTADLLQPADPLQRLLSGGGGNHAVGLALPEHRAEPAGDPGGGPGGQAGAELRAEGSRWTSGVAFRPRREAGPDHLLGDLVRSLPRRTPADSR